MGFGFGVSFWGFWVKGVDTLFLPPKARIACQHTPQQHYVLGDQIYDAFLLALNLHIEVVLQGGPREGPPICQPTMWPLVAVCNEDTTWRHVRRCSMYVATRHLVVFQLTWKPGISRTSREQFIKGWPPIPFAYIIARAKPHTPG